ncbi:MAG: elongation factor P maturation arginine rhamnosyltransferase EarP [Comamonadaceae bacterium]|nr:elongation factor P maturation arginine rhamnosyltransferase EarP [Comamonadaceae bacterium]
MADAARLRPPAVGLRPELRARRGLAGARASGPARPFVWQIYPQHDGAHAAKLAGACSTLAGRRRPTAGRAAGAAWNGLGAGRRRCPTPAAWRAPPPPGATSAAAQPRPGRRAAALRPRAAPEPDALESRLCANDRWVASAPSGLPRSAARSITAAALAGGNQPRRQPRWNPP